MVSPTQHEGLADSSRTCCNSRPRDRWEFFTRVRSRPARSATAVLIQGFHANGRLQRAESVYDCRRIDRPERGPARADFARRGPFSPWPGVPESIPCDRIFPEGGPMRVRLAAVALSLVLSPTALAVTVVTAPSGPSKMLTEPALSAERIAFVYGNDIWTCRLDGSDVNRVTSGPGVKTRPAFSPDGSLLAFSGELDGNLDAYVVPAAGGVPKRLTWHPARDIVQGFTPDGRSVLFTSARAATNNRHTQLYVVPVEGGLETVLPIPYADRAAYSPDGRTIAYSPNRPAHLQWKRYRGGLVSKVWLFDVASNAIDRVPQPATRCNDADPMWLGAALYLRSDRDGEFNLYAYDAKSKALTRLTDYKEFPVLNAAAAAGRIVFEQAATLHLLDLASSKTTDLSITVAGDLLETRPRWAKGAKWIRGAAISPSGARAAFEFRGEIVTGPAEKGEPRHLTAATAAHERAPAWSPDGKEIAYVSDETGENGLGVRG